MHDIADGHLQYFLEIRNFSKSDDFWEFWNLFKIIKYLNATVLLGDLNLFDDFESMLLQKLINTILTIILAKPTYNRDHGGSSQSPG